MVFLYLLRGTETKYTLTKMPSEKLQEGKLSGKEYRGEWRHGKPKAKPRYQETEASVDGTQARENMAITQKFKSKIKA